VAWENDLVAFSAGQLSDRERSTLYGRGVTDEQIRLFQIGYINRRLPSLQGADDFIEWSHRGSKLDDMFVLPLTTMLGAVRGFQFRHVERERKGYTDFFLSQDEPVLFGLAQSMPHLWKTEGAFLVEGAFDLFPLQRHFPAIFPTMSAKVTIPVVRMLRRLVRRVWLGYDMDARGRKASFEFAREYGHEFDTRIVAYPKIFKVGSKELIKDPGDLWEAWGDARVGEFVQSITES
jgi:hypothetical protein